jgi:hypothetical protein
MVFDPASRYFTTIGNYKQSGNDVTYNGQIYRWSKHHEWEKFIDLPSRISQPFQLAMNVTDPADRTLLEKHGWGLQSAVEMSLDIFGAYPKFFRRSRAQFTVAKDQNVRLRSGWFSERDACYLASGKPVVSQDDPGFSNVLPTGQGLFGLPLWSRRLRRLMRSTLITRDIAKRPATSRMSILMPSGSPPRCSMISCSWRSRFSM